MFRALYQWVKNKIYPPKKDNVALQLPQELQFEVLKFRSPSENISSASASKNINKKLCNNALWDEFLEPEYKANDTAQSVKQIFTHSPEKRLYKYRPKDICSITQE